ncbi:MAG TPA: ABC transporter permease [Gemmatimonadales bacterium]
MRLLRNVALSRKALWRHRTRTVLALGGTAVGVAAVLAMIAIGEGAERAVVARIGALGRNLLVVSAGPQERVPGRRVARGATVQTLTVADRDAIIEQSSLIALAAPSQDRPIQLNLGDRSTTATVRGTTVDYETIRDFRTAEGRYFTAEENRAGMRVAVIGARVRDRMFPGETPVGQSLRIGRVPFEVIGVLEAKGLSITGGTDEDAQVIIPITTALRRVFNLDYLSLIYLEVADPAMMNAAESEVAAILRERHRLNRRNQPDDFRMQNQNLVLAAELETVSSFRFMITGMGAVALVVGGVGILSIMLLSVRERRSEIGLRVAVGARRQDIWTQFLVEALTLGGAGGLAGLGLGLAAAWVVATFTEWSAVVTIPSVVMAVASALAVGLVFGVYPAQRAASWDPIEALRTE